MICAFVGAIASEIKCSSQSMSNTGTNISGAGNLSKCTRTQICNMGGKILSIILNRVDSRNLSPKRSRAHMTKVAFLSVDGSINLALGGGVK